jgi:AcrR family transcriptional regulator
MSGVTADDALLDRIAAMADTSAVPLAEMSMDAIASGLGMTRMTLYRRAGTRDAIVAALRARGVDARRQPDVYERVIVATARLLREQPIAALTLEQIADAANCSLPAIYARFGSRQGVLKAVIERHSPLLPMREAVATNLEAPTADLRHDIRHMYETLYRQLDREWRVIRSFIAEVTRDPDSEVGQAVRDWYVPQVRDILLPLIQRHIDEGMIRPIPIPLIVSFFAAPMGLHVGTRGYVQRETGFELPDAESVIDLFTDMFCRAVGTEPASPA